MKIPALPEDPELRKILLLRAEAQALREDRLASYRPHAKQRVAHAMGHHYMACAIFGGNRTGKSECARMETAYHLTGLYPDDWPGRRWDRATRCYAASDTWSANIVGVQKMLLGDLGQWGTGAIPKRCLGPITLQSGVAGAVATVKVKHVSGRYSTLIFKAYEQGRKLFQSDSIDYAWLDEEPPWPVFTETVLRVMDSRGYILLAFTPLGGMSEVASHFRNVDIDLKAEGGEEIKNVSRGWVSFEWADNPFLTAEAVAAMRQQFASKPHELAAREKGEPSLGSGACYPVSPSSIVVSAEDITIGRRWPRIAGADFGWTNPTAFLRAAKDPNTGITYVYQEYKKAGAHVSEHATHFNTEYWIPPIFGDASAAAANIKDGESLLAEYEKYGVRINQAERQEVESGIARCLGLMLEGRLKILDTCPLLLREMQLYARDEKGKIVKRNEFHGEHLCDAMRYMIQNLDMAQVPEDEDAPESPRRRGHYDRYGGWS